MCYYATTNYPCGDWKWGNMKLRCPRQHRMGETCGAKLVHHESVTQAKEDCRLCQELSIKRRRLQRERDNIARWSREGSKFAASIEKAQREAKQLEEVITDLYNRRPSVQISRNPTLAPAYNSSSEHQSGSGRHDRHGRHGRHG